jgi:hypothetical protein
VEVSGAAFYAPEIASRIEDADRPMPPRFGLEQHQIDTLLAWALADPVSRGAPRPDNQRPQIAFEEIGRDAATISLRYDLHDPDGDLVSGVVRLTDGAGRLVGALHSGRDVLVLDTTGLTGVYPLRAFADDGAQIHDIPAGTIDVGTP